MALTLTYLGDTIMAKSNAPTNSRYPAASEEQHEKGKVGGYLNVHIQLGDGSVKKLTPFGLGLREDNPVERRLMEILQSDPTAVERLGTKISFTYNEVTDPSAQVELDF